MKKYAVIFDTNSYRKLVLNKDKKTIESDIKKIIDYAQFVMFGPLFVLSIVTFWGVANRLYNLRQGKRLFGIIDAGIIFGIIIKTMAKKEYISRFLRIIKRIKKGDYPSYNVLFEYLMNDSYYFQQDSFHSGFSKRTLQRDLKEIRLIFNIDICYYGVLFGCRIMFDHILYNCLKGTRRNIGFCSGFRFYDIELIC